MNDRNPWQSEPALIRATQPSRWYWQIRLHSDPLEGCSGCEPALINGHFHLANQYQQQRHLPRWLALPHRLSNQIQILAPKNAVQNQTEIRRFLQRIEGKNGWNMWDGRWLRAKMTKKKVKSSQLPRRWKEEGPSASWCCATPLGDADVDRSRIKRICSTGNRKNKKKSPAPRRGGLCSLRVKYDLS